MKPGLARRYAVEPGPCAVSPLDAGLDGGIIPAPGTDLAAGASAGGEWTHGTFFRFLLYLPTPIRVSVPWCLPVAEVELELGPKCHPPGGLNQNRGWFLRNAAAMGIVSYVGSIVRSGAWKLVPSSAFPLAIVAP